MIRADRAALKGIMGATILIFDFMICDPATASWSVAGELGWMMGICDIQPGGVPLGKKRTLGPGGTRTSSWVLARW